MGLSKKKKMSVLLNLLAGKKSEALKNVKTRKLILPFIHSTFIEYGPYWVRVGSRINGAEGQLSNVHKMRRPFSFFSQRL